MNPSFDIFIDRITDNQRNIVYYLHDQFISYPGIHYKTRFKIPFYYYHSWVCYLNPVKKEKIELCFINGQELTDVSGILDNRNRKMVSGVMLDNVNTIPLNAIMELYAEAIVIDRSSIIRGDKKGKQSKI